MSILQGDCTKIMQELPEESIHQVVTSPPYDDIRSYKGFEFDYKAVLAGIYRVLVDGGVCCWVVGDKITDGNRSLTSFRQGIAAQEIGFKVNDVIIYQKANTPFMRTNAYTQAHELVLVLVKGDKPRTFNALKKKSGDRRTSRTVQASKKPDGSHKKVALVSEAGRMITRTNVWTYATGSGVARDKKAFKHPAIMPERLATDLVLSWSRPGECVLDPMCGSGTTCLVAKQNGRHYIGIDISKEYCDIANERLGDQLI